jgi:hypothetical protein
MLDPDPDSLNPGPQHYPYFQELDVKGFFKILKVLM